MPCAERQYNFCQYTCERREVGGVMKGFGCINISDADCRVCTWWLRTYDCKNARNILRDKRDEKSTEKEAQEIFIRE